MGRIVALFLILTALAAACMVAVPPARADAASADSWTTMTPLPHARAYFGLAAVAIVSLAAAALLVYLVKVKRGKR